MKLQKTRSAIATASLIASFSWAAYAGPAVVNAAETATEPKAATPIRHLVVIFQENVSFDHYFGTYPRAANLPGEPAFQPRRDTPPVNTLATPLDVAHGFAPFKNVKLLTGNPTRFNAANGGNAINPFRLDRSQAATADQNHEYDAEQQAFNEGAMDLFPKSVGIGDTMVSANQVAPLNTVGLVMGYYDGNTITALWNYAQHFAMNDNSFGTTFGPSTVGALNLIAGQTNGVLATNAAPAKNGSNLDGEISSDGNGGITMTGDPQPLGDICSKRDAVSMQGKNIGDLLNAAGVSWGFFSGGFDRSVVDADGSSDCQRGSRSAITGQYKLDYIPHHQPFQYYASTANPTHARPSAVGAIGRTYEADGKTRDPANHQYDLHDFFDAIAAGNYPAVSFLKAPGYQDGHAGYSNPLDEQEFIVRTLNFLQQRAEWQHTLVLIAYDDSDGWYDHQMSPIVNPSSMQPGASFVSNGVKVTGLGDFLNGRGICKSGLQQGRPVRETALPGPDGKVPVQGRCGYGPRMPLLAISPYAKPNHVDHTLTDQTSILRFIEDNWLSGQRLSGSFDALAGPLNNMLDFSGKRKAGVLILDPVSGQVCIDCNRNKPQ
ncbi:MAG: alkaline phosphatase family protein [Burkholderiaceae bacterium]|nr:alkaline phosphatase family protein [Burkholderiaceae bacterium]